MNPRASALFLSNYKAACDWPAACNYPAGHDAATPRTTGQNRAKYSLVAQIDTYCR